MEHLKILSQEFILLFLTDGPSGISFHPYYFVVVITSWRSSVFYETMKAPNFIKMP